MTWIILAIAVVLIVAAVILIMRLWPKNKKGGQSHTQKHTLQEVFGSESIFKDLDAFGGQGD